MRFTSTVTDDDGRVFHAVPTRSSIEIALRVDSRTNDVSVHLTVELDMFGNDVAPSFLIQRVALAVNGVVSPDALALVQRMREVEESRYRRPIYILFGNRTWVGVALNHDYEFMPQVILFSDFEPKGSNDA